MAPGPGAYDLKFNCVERKEPQGFSFGKRKDTEKKPAVDNRLLLYPQIDATRPNHKGAKGLIKKPTYIPPPPVVPEKIPIEKEKVAEVIPKRKPGVSIAPPRYSALTTEELERLLWNQMLNNP